MKKTLTCMALALTLGQGPAPATAQSTEAYLGAIWLFGGNFCPVGTREANGQILSISEYSALFALFGVQYGGDGRTTFALPDMTSMVPSQGGKYCVNIRGVFPSRS
ncbi:phage tail protein [Mameliella sediminis]|uniref:phage tail protein n=1 Tax=Mameliella sediminis TaxID=2836866 RepID=UPI001C488915|nr:phage tail protein [Mameliella sediminis]MBV7394698.1 phage tail protein [Mameliella sediminis]MBY6113400.1 phage tail protein [Antarctobacter heliothermus]MBY6143252.1 phage tail protein [Mameliella alba]MCA0953024.1 phage tail protein [Mameliella alba]